MKCTRLPCGGTQAICSGNTPFLAGNSPAMLETHLRREQTHPHKEHAHSHRVHARSYRVHSHSCSEHPIHIGNFLFQCLSEVSIGKIHIPLHIVVSGIAQDMRLSPTSLFQLQCREHTEIIGTYILLPGALQPAYRSTSILPWRTSFYSLSPLPFLTTSCITARRTHLNVSVRNSVHGIK